jgi:hypothetical protein
MPHLSTMSLIVALTLSNVAIAQPVPEEPVILTTPDTDPEVVEYWIEQLGNEDWLMRDLATLELSELDPGISLETLELYITREDLTLEQRSRLWLACLRRFQMRPKGALGVQWGEIRVGAIEVIPIPDNPEFPASMVLKRGDHIALVGDRIMDGTFSLRAEILSRDPGDILPVTLIRDGRTGQYDLKLGAFSNLTGGARMESQMLVTALQRRWERMGLDTPQSGSVGTAIGLDDWQRAAFPDGIVPDPRDPELIAPRGMVLGPGMPDSPDGTRRARMIIDVWIDPADFAVQTEQRAALLMGERLQPMIALLNLYTRQQVQLRSEIADELSEEESSLIQSELETLRIRVDRLKVEIESIRSTDSTP